MISRIWVSVGGSIEENERLRKEFKSFLPNFYSWVNKFIPLETGSCYVYFSFLDRKAKYLFPHGKIEFYSDFLRYLVYVRKPCDFDSVGSIRGCVMTQEEDSGSNDLRDGPYSEETWRAIIKQIRGDLPYSVPFRDVLLRLY